MENFDYMEIRSEEFQEILGQRPRWVVRYGIILLIVFMIILLGGAWLFKYPQTIEGKLVLTSSIPTVQLESKVTGIITDVYVKDGQKVEQGEKLALIQNTANVNDIELLEKNIAEWYHAVDNGKVCQKSRQKLVLGAIQVSYSSLLVKIDAYNRFVSWDPYKSKIAAQNEKLHISRDRHKISVSQKEISEKELKIKEGSLRRHEILYAKGLISKEEFEASETKYLQERMSIESARLNINENYSKELELTSNVISLEHERLERLSSLQVDIIASLEQVSSEIQKWKDSYLLVSPIQGIVTFTNIWGAYQNVEAGIIVFNIIPTPQKELIGKLTMNMMRSGKVKKNQSVNIYFDNYPEREFGMVKGVVKSISLVPNKDNNYIVEVSFPYGLKTTYGKMLPEQQEMRATAKIVTENTNLLEQLLLPFKMIFKNQ